MVQLLYILLVSASTFSKSEYFKVLSGNDASSMTKLIGRLEDISSSPEQQAYLGTLKMKRSEQLKTAKEKLALFKEGKGLLEKAIVASPKNVEYRFLRLMIQENAPKVLKYNTHIKEDAKLVSNGYQSLVSEVRTAVVNYAKQSDNLSL
jgi:hypothetical protein